MKNTIMTLAAASTLAIAAPATAQYLGGNFEARIQQLQTDIQVGVQSGAIRRADARTLRDHLRVLRQTERSYAINGFTRSERRDLQDRVQNLRQQIRYAERVGPNRYAGSGFIDRNRDGWDDRDFDRDGRWDDNVYGMGGPYDEVNRICATRSGFPGIIGSLLGTDRCLTVGERAPRNLSFLPYEHRSQFRDGGGYYHRYLDGNVVQIDARTGTVVRIYDVD